MSVVVKVFIGYDPKESLSAYVLAHSILRRSSLPVQITFLRQDVLRKAGWYKRPVDERASTEFSLTRFLVPFLCDYVGWAIFMDCDMLVTGDIAKLWRMRENNQAVQVVQHQYESKTDTKMDGQRNEQYPCKNWSSLMLINNGVAGRHFGLTPHYVGRATPAQLHRFEWVDNPSWVGALPVEWNHLVGEYDTPERTPKCIHWTLGGPWWQDYADVEYANLWRAELHNMVMEGDGPDATAAEILASEPDDDTEQAGAGAGDGDDESSWQTPSV